jgi:uncharacterized circularly permuted ATP-grasp superfamily protein
VDFSQYDAKGFYDEMVDETKGIRPAYLGLTDYLKSLTAKQLHIRNLFVEKTLLSLGITFTVYNDSPDGTSSNTERIFPLDIIPRIVSASEWKKLEAGLKQRNHALNLFLQDIYNDKLILKDKRIPSDIVLGSKGYLKPCEGFTPPQKIWCHIAGTDLIREPNGDFAVLEDNIRCPSGVAYVLENREIMKRAFSTLMGKLNIQTVLEYPQKLAQLMRFVSPVQPAVMAVLTPGVYNSAYFEHACLARHMGIELVQSQDLVVHDGYLMMRTTAGLQRVDVLYRRIDDTYLDPLVFNPDSALGVPGLFEVYRKGRVALVNAPGTGVADDKVVYAFVPDMIRYYLNEDPILPNIQTYICENPSQRDYVLNHLDQLVVKTANDAGGYGMLIGPHSTKEEQDEFRERILAYPRTYIAQPTISFSRAPSFVDGQIEGRHVDLRPYVLSGQETYVLPGGLTRVALRKGSLVVNSSQGGGSKDTWVLGEETDA